MILIDTSAWVDYLRGTSGTATDAVRSRLATRSDHVVMCEPIAAELLAGPTDEAVVTQIERLVNGLPSLELDPVTDFRSAALLHRAARRSGRTVRSLNGCLIAAIALRHDAVVLHKENDFDVLAEITALRVDSLL